MNPLCAFILMMFVTNSYAWETLKGYDVLIDKKSMYTSENKQGKKIVHIWAIWDISDVKAKSLKSLIDLDCEGRSYSSYKVLVYDKKKGQGKMIDTTYFPGGYIEPDTFYFDLHQTYCKDWWKVW